MKRRNALKNIGAALSVSLIPIGLLAKDTAVVTIDPEKVSRVHKFGHNPSVDDKIDDIYLNHMYPNRWEYVCEKHHKRILRYGSEKNKGRY